MLAGQQAPQRRAPRRSERMIFNVSGMKKTIFLKLGMAAAALALPAAAACGQTVVKDSVKIYFRQDYSTLDLSLRHNRAVLDSIAARLRRGSADSVLVLRRVLVEGAASPEGTIARNRRLSERRAGRLFNHLSRYAALPDSLLVFRYLGRDWAGLARLVEADPAVPHHDATLGFVRDIVRRSQGGERAADNNVGRLSRFRGGAPYRYMYRELFPELRASRMVLWYDRIWNPLKLRPVAVAGPLPPMRPAPLVPVAIAPPEERPPFYMAVKTNMVYDALLVPNVGVEFYLGRGLSLGADWMYGWWKKDRAHWYWRAYGGGVTLRKWFGRRAAAKPLAGHHVGLFALVQTFDFETGGRGYMGGRPGGDIFDRACFGGGVEYGYSLPVRRRLNIDFTAGIGYLGGRYHEYVPQDGCYVWQSTRKLRYFGPTRVEVSLVWLIGRGNYNKYK